MKKNSFIGLLCAGVMAVYAQPYGQTSYSNTSRITSGYFAKTINPGYLMAGLQSNGGIHIERTDPSGTFGGGSFIKDYKVIINASCGGVSPGTISPDGVTILETNPITPALENFVMAGAWKEGAFFSVHQADGQPIAGFTFPFGGTAIVDKPFICESAYQPGIYYITGQYNNLHVCVKGKA